MMYRVSPHLSEDRFERIMYIMENLGIGEEVCQTPCVGYTDRFEVLTSTGVVLIISNDNIVITAYVPTMKEALAVWKKSSPMRENLRMPEWLNTKVKTNRRHHEAILRLNVTCGYYEKKIQKKFY